MSSNVQNVRAPQSLFIRLRMVKSNFTNANEDIKGVESIGIQFSWSRRIPKMPKKTCKQCPEFEKIAGNMGLCNKYHFQIAMNLAKADRVCEGMEEYKGGKVQA